MSATGRYRPSASFTSCGRSARVCARRIEVGLIHRDIKPGNIFAAQRGGLYDVVKLLDFGLVKPVGENASARLSQEGGISGTPLFMSPEQARGLDEIDARSDIYSLGAVAYALLTGRPPFDGTNPMDVMIAHVRDEVEWPSEHQAERASRSRTRGSPLSGQEPGGSFPRCRQSGASPRRMRRRRPVDAAAGRPLVARARSDGRGAARDERGGDHLGATPRSFEHGGAVPGAPTLTLAQHVVPHPSAISRTRTISTIRVPLPSPSRGRATPRWSVAGAPTLSPRSIAALPASGAWVMVGPPLFARAPSRGRSGRRPFPRGRPWRHC